MATITCQATACASVQEHPLVLQLQTKFEPAMEAYLQAQSLQPGLPGLKQNMETLRTDMGL